MYISATRDGARWRSVPQIENGDPGVRTAIELGIGPWADRAAPEAAICASGAPSPQQRTAMAKLNVLANATQRRLPWRDPHEWARRAHRSAALRYYQALGRSKLRERVVNYDTLSPSRKPHSTNTGLGPLVRQ
jgi:hypothetical protein